MLLFFKPEGKKSLLNSKEIGYNAKKEYDSFFA